MSAAQDGREQDDARLLELRDDVAVAKPEDLPALFEQMHHLGALRAQRGQSLDGTVDRGEPVLRSPAPRGGRQAARRRLGRAARVVLIGSRLRRLGRIRIVDWRHAPVSRIYYRYGEGDDYEEELGGRVVEGDVLARRERERSSGASSCAWRRRRGRSCAARTGAGSASRRTRCGSRRRSAGRRARASPRKPRLGVGRRRASCGRTSTCRRSRRCSTSSSSTSSRAPSAGLVAIQGSAGSGKTTVGLHRVGVPRVRRAAALPAGPDDGRRPERGARPLRVAVLPSLGVEGVPVTTFARFAARLVAAAVPEAADDRRATRRRRSCRARRRHPAMLRGDRRAPRRGRSTRIDARLRDGDGASGRRASSSCAPGRRPGADGAAAGRARTALASLARGQAARSPGVARRLGAAGGDAERARAARARAPARDARAWSGRGTSS